MKRLLLRLLLLAGAVSACGDQQEVPLVDGDERAEPMGGLGMLLPGDEGAGEVDATDGAAPEPSFCDPAECPELVLFGVSTPGCCRFGNLCGGRVQVSERTWACLAPEVNEQGEVLRDALTRAAREAFVSDPGCPSHVIDGQELRGCCRGGICGLDTQPWSRSASSFGLLLPRACLDPREAAELANDPLSPGSPPRCP